MPRLDPFIELMFKEKAEQLLLEKPKFKYSQAT